MIRDEEGAHRIRIYRFEHDRLRRIRKSSEPTSAQELKLPAGYTYQWSGEYEFELRAKERLKLILPIVFFVIFCALHGVPFRDRSLGPDLSHVYATDRRTAAAVASRLQLQRCGSGLATSRCLELQSRRAL